MIIKTIKAVIINNIITKAEQLIVIIIQNTAKTIYVTKSHTKSQITNQNMNQDTRINMTQDTNKDTSQISHSTHQTSNP